MSQFRTKDNQNIIFYDEYVEINEKQYFYKDLKSISHCEEDEEYFFEYNEETVHIKYQEDDEQAILDCFLEYVKKQRQRQKETQEQQKEQEQREEDTKDNAPEEISSDFQEKKLKTSGAVMHYIYKLRQPLIGAVILALVAIVPMLFHDKTEDNLNSEEVETQQETTANDISEPEIQEESTAENNFYNNNLTWEIEGNTIYVGKINQTQHYESKNKTNFLEALGADKSSYKNADRIVIEETVYCENDMSYMFSGLSNIKSIEGLWKIKTDKTKSMNHLFSGCSSLESIDISEWDTYETYDMNYMFYNCKNLKQVKLPPLLGTGNTFTTKSMFENCSSLENLTFRMCLTCGNKMFKNCKNLKRIEGMDEWNMMIVEDVDEMFAGCSNLEEVDIENWSMGSYDKKFDVEEVFKDCPKIKRPIKEPRYVWWNAEHGLYEVE